MDFQASSQRITRRAALRIVAMGAGLTLVAACGSPAANQTQPQPTAAAVKPAAPTNAAQHTRARPAAPTAAQQAPAAASGQKVALRWFFWTGTEEERQFWESLAADAMQKVPNVEVKFETDTVTNFWTGLPTMVASGGLPDLIG